jgi:hypothetical protein
MFFTTKFILLIQKNVLLYAPNGTLFFYHVDVNFSTIQQQANKHPSSSLSLHLNATPLRLFIAELVPFLLRKQGAFYALLWRNPGRNPY